MTPLQCVQAQLEAYNSQDIEAMMSCYDEDCVIADLNGTVTQRGVAAVRARYAAMFAQYPHNRATIVNRIALGDVVIDHEDVRRGPDGPRFEAIAVYTVSNGRIARVDFVK